MRARNYQDIVTLFAKHGVSADPMIVGLRNEEKAQADRFNDHIIIAHGGQVEIYLATTDPGVYYTLRPLNKKGAAHLCYGFHKNGWMLGLHKGKPGLVQHGNKVTVWRDENMNFAKDPGEIVESGYFGINFHRQGDDDDLIERASAGCQVFRHEDDLEEFLDICRTYDKGIRRKRFSYLVVPREELKWVL
jgi:hypothetical protein